MDFCISLPLKLVNQQVVSYLRKKVVGQDEVLATFSLKLLENLFSYLDFVVSGDFSTEGKPKNNFLIKGPTGSGKTFLVKQVCCTLNLPLIEISCVDLTPVGYRGPDVQEILAKRIEELRTNQEKAPYSMLEKYFFVKNVLFKGSKFYEDIDKGNFLYTMSLLYVLFSYDFIRQNFRLRDEEISFLRKLDKSFNSFKGNLRIFGDFSFNLSYSSPFAVVFLDEFDKTLVDVGTHNFYSMIQNQILKLVEGSDVSAEKDRNGLVEFNSSFLTFVFAGSFYEVSEENISPELRGRINVPTLELKKLSASDYKEIIKNLTLSEGQQGFNAYRKVSFDESFFEEVANVCHSLNSREYLGVRRLFSLWDTLREAIHTELLFSSEDLVLNGNFVKFVCEREENFERISRNNQKLSDYWDSLKEKINVSEIEKCLNDAIFEFYASNVVKNVGVFHEDIKIWEIDLDDVLNIKKFFKFLLTKNSEGRTVIGYLIGKLGLKKIVLKSLSSSEIKSLSKLIKKFKKELGNQGKVSLEIECSSFEVEDDLLDFEL
ncbi:AAA family ATPase [Thermovibrio sp.]